MAAGNKVVWSATPTPFLPDGSLDEAGIEHLVEHHRRLGVNGLFLGGTCGEGPFMPNAQREELLRRVRRLVGEQVQVCFQVSDSSAARVKDNIRVAAERGVDIPVIARPAAERFYGTELMRRYFLEPIEASPMSVGIYIIGKPDDPALNLDLWLEIVSHPKVRLVKDSSASQEFMEALGRLKQRRPRLQVMTGYEFDVISAVATGYDGGLLGTGILNAGFIRRAVDAVAVGDMAAARSWQERSNEFLYDLFGRDLALWLGGLKYALKRLGIFSDEFMHLHFPLTADQRRHIDEAVEREREFICPPSTP